MRSLRALTLLATVGVLGAFAPLSPPRACDVRMTHSPLFAVGNSDLNQSPAVANDINDPTGGCGEGFVRVSDAAGDCCAFDYDSVAATFGAASSPVDGGDPYREEREEKNRLRRKYGAKSLSKDEYIVLRAQVRKMEKVEGKLQQEGRIAAVEERERLESENAPGLFESFMDAAGFQSTCQSNVDCDQPEVCCDFGFRKTCCSSGEANREIKNEYAVIRVPQTLD